MALQDTDLLLVGRGQSSYNITYTEAKTAIEADALAAVATEKERAEGIEAALNSDIETEAAARIAGDTAEKERAEAAEAALAEDVSTETAARIAGDNTEKERAEAAEASLAAAVEAERERALGAETSNANNLIQEVIDRGAGDTTLNNKIDALVLGDMTDVTTGGVTNNQALVYNADAGEWQAKEIVLSSNLNFKGEIDLTTAAPAAEAGDLYVNKSAGAIDASFGAGFQASLPNGAAGSEFVAYNGTDWVYGGTIGGTLDLTTFSADNIDATAGSTGELAYNSTTGVYTFTRVDLDSRIPKDLSSLPALPV